VSELADRQLVALAEVASVLDSNGFDHWLFGGWAVDFHVGRVTRPHDDLDIAVWLHDSARVAEVLDETEWRHAPQAGEDGGTGYERAGIRLELTYIEREGDDVFTPFSFGRGVWPRGSFGADERELRGAVCAWSRSARSCNEDADPRRRCRSDEGSATSTL